MCINEPTPGKAKNPTNHRITIITTIVQNVSIANYPPKFQLLVSGTCEVDLLILLSAVPCLSSGQPLSPRLKRPTCFVLHLSLRQAQIQPHPFPIRFQDESLSTLPALLLF